MNDRRLKKPGDRQKIGVSSAVIFVVALLLAGVYIKTKPNAVISHAQAGSAVRVLVSQDGIYELRLSDVKAAGLAWTDPARLRLSLRGKLVPLWIQKSGSETVMRFYGQASTSVYTRQNVYWLEGSSTAADTGPSAAAYAAPAGGPATTHYTQTLHLEENLIYMPQVKEGDHWLWKADPAPREVSIDFQLGQRASGPGSLRAEIWASTEAPQNPDHHLRLTLNGQPVADERWEGQGHHMITASIPDGIYKDGANTLVATAVGDTGAAADVTFIDWLEVSFPLAGKAAGDQLDFYGQAGPLTLSGFSGAIEIYDITNSALPVRLDSFQGDKTGSFAGQPGHHYLAAGPTGYHKPDSIQRAALSPDLKAAGSGADYVAIGPQALLMPLQPLLDYRMQAGLKAAAVPVDAIYDQFNQGMPEPEAIRQFLEYAQKNWKPAPRFVLLVGDASYDPRGYLAPAGANQLPTFFVETQFGGETASDVLFARLEGDQKTSMSVGRVPARTPEQVQVFVQKTLQYEQSPAPGDWRKRLLTIADGQDPSFAQDAKFFRDRFPADSYEFSPYEPAAGDTGASQEISERINQGAIFVAYFGHGSINMWGKDRLFTVEDVNGLNNRDRLPVILNFTCLTGLFTHPKQTSLAEAFLFQKDGGAVAVLAATSLTLPTDQSFLVQSLADAFVKDPAQSLGEMYRSAQNQVTAGGSGTQDVLQTFLLFGDPALHLVNP